MDEAGRASVVHATRFDEAAQRTAFDILHYEELFAICGQSGVEHADHTRVVDARQRFHFLQKLLADPGIQAGLVEKHFDHHALFQKLTVACEIDHAHSAAAEL